VAYPVDLALDQWLSGQSRVMGDPELADATDAVLAELRERLGGVFHIAELAELYGEGTDWAAEIVQRHASGTDASWAIEAAFARYAAQASDYAGGRRRVNASGD
jgi:hypothetical protein